MITAILPLVFATPDVDSSSRALLASVAKKYASNVSMSGRIINAVSDGQGVVTTTTEFAYVKPSKVSLTQTTNAKMGKTFRLASDGVKFSYDRPVELADQGKLPPRVVETVHKNNVKMGKDGKPYVDSFYMMTVADMYVAASHSLADAGPIHDMVFGAQVNTNAWLRNVQSVSAPETTKLDGETVTKITGQYRSVRLNEDVAQTKVSAGKALQVGKEAKSTNVPATFTFYIGSDNLIRRFMTVEEYVVEKKDVRLASVWDVTVTLNPDIPLKAFTSY